MISSAARAESMVLTEDVIQRYTAIFPAYWRITRELESASKMQAGEAKDAKIAELIERRTHLLTTNGWEDFVEFMEADARIMKAITPLNLLAKFKDHPEPDRKQVEDQVAEKLKGYTPEEIALMKKNLLRITKMREKALGN